MSVDVAPTFRSSDEDFADSAIDGTASGECLAGSEGRATAVEIHSSDEGLASDEAFDCLASVEDLADLVTGGRALFDKESTAWDRASDEGLADSADDDLASDEGLEDLVTETRASVEVLTDSGSQSGASCV